MRERKVVIIGTGAVGSTFAYMLLQSGLAPEIMLIDLERIVDVALSDREQEALHRSANIVRDVISKIDLEAG